MNRYNFAAVGDERIEQSAHLERLTTPQAPPLPGKKQPAKGIPPPYASVDRNVYILILVVVALAGVSYWALKHRRENRAPVDERPAVETKAAPAPVARLVTPPQTATTATQPDANVPAKLVLNIEVTERSFIKLDADGESVINDELRRGYHRSIEAKEAFRFRTIGNAAGITLTLNDLPIPALGRDGQVLHDVVFDHAALLKLQTPAQTPQ